MIAHFAEDSLTAFKSTFERMLVTQQDFISTQESRFIMNEANAIKATCCPPFSTPS
jgi:hypothetical protein